MSQQPPDPFEAWDPTANYHGGDPYSTAAHDSVKAHKAALRQWVFDIIAAAPEGMTSDEVEVKTGLPHQTCSARFTELKKAGRIVARGSRPTRSGRMAAVYFATTPSSVPAAIPQPSLQAETGRLF